MKVHPTPFDNLRRLPHIFSKILELPFTSESDVAIDETPSHFRFTLTSSSVTSADIYADTVEIYPGITKVVIRGTGFDESGEFDVDTWRYRLPERTRLELVRAEYWEGDIVVTVPKEEEREGRGGFGIDRGLVLVH